MKKNNLNYLLVSIVACILSFCLTLKVEAITTSLTYDSDSKKLTMDVKKDNTDNSSIGFTEAWAECYDDRYEGNKAYLKEIKFYNGNQKENINNSKSIKDWDNVTYVCNMYYSYKYEDASGKSISMKSNDGGKYSFVKSNSSSSGSGYTVTFDQNNYNGGYGLYCEDGDGDTDGFVAVSPGVCVKTGVASGTSIKFPAMSNKMYTTNWSGMLMGWTTQQINGVPQCVVNYDGVNVDSYSDSMIDYNEVDSFVVVNSDVTYYGCYNTIVNGVRYAAAGASADGQDVPCGSALGIVECLRESDGKDYCYYDYKNGQAITGKVYRDKLTLQESAALGTCGTATSDDSELPAYRYPVKEAYINETYDCGTGLYITDCNNGICNYTKVKDNEGNVKSKKGTVKQNYLKQDRLTAISNCGTTEIGEDTKTCSGYNEPLLNMYGEFTYTVCHKINVLPSKQKDIILNNVSCDTANGYKLNKNKDDMKEVSHTCNSGKSLCSTTYTVTCESTKPKISATYGKVGSNGLGEITVKILSNSANVVGYYVSEDRTNPTSKTKWEKVSGKTFTITGTPGVKYIWVKDKNGNISDVVSAAIIDTVNTDTTVSKLELVDSNGKLSIPNKVSYLDETVKDSNYVRLSNNLRDDSNVIADAFNPFDTEYKLEVSSPTVTVYATLTSKDASYVDGYEPRTVNLKYGINTVLIKIKNKDGKIRTYTILVTRNDDRSADNTLNDIKLSVGTIDFNANVTNYKITIPKNTNSVNVSAVISSDLANYESGYEPGTVNITGNTTVKLIKVKSQTGSTRTYVLTFVKEGTDEIVKESLQLSNLSISDVYLPFEENISNYNVTADYDTDVIDIYGILKDKTSSYIVKVKKKNDKDYNVVSNSGILLDVGENYIEIIVTNTDNETAYYRVTVIRKEFGLDVSNDTTLKDLNVAGYDIDFNPNKKEYTVKIKTEKSLVINAVPNSNRAEVFIRGNENVTGFTTVRVKVVAENGSYDTYSIEIGKDAYSKALEISAVVAGAVIILISSCIIVIKKRNRAKKEYFEE